MTTQPEHCPANFRLECAAEVQCSQPKDHGAVMMLPVGWHTAELGGTTQDGLEAKAMLLWEDRSVAPIEALQRETNRIEKYADRGSAYDYGFNCEECGALVESKDRQLLARKRASRTLCATHIAEARAASRHPSDW